MTEMTSKERLITALKGGKPDRVPVSPDMTRWVRGNRDCCCIRHQLEANEAFGFDPFLTLYQYTATNISNDYVYTPGGGYNYSSQGFYGDLPDVDVDIRIENRKDQVWYHRTFRTPAGDLRDVIQWARPNAGYGDGPNPHRVEPLIKTMGDLKAFRYLFPKPRKDLVADIPLIVKEYGSRAVIAASDTVHLGGWGAEALGAEKILLMSIEEPELLEAVARIENEAHLANLRAFLENGVEVVLDSWFQCGLSTGWKPETYKDIFLPLVKETIDFVHRYGATYVYYDAGRIKKILPWLVEAGIDVLSGLQPAGFADGDIDLAEVKKAYGSRIALMGGLDPCYTFDMGTIETVHDATKKVIEDGAAGGGFVAGMAMSIAPEVPQALLRELTSAVRTYGKY